MVIKVLLKNLKIQNVFIDILEVLDRSTMAISLAITIPIKLKLNYSYCHCGHVIYGGEARDFNPNPNRQLYAGYLYIIIYRIY